MTAATKLYLITIYFADNEGDQDHLIEAPNTGEAFRRLFAVWGPPKEIYKMNIREHYKLVQIMTQKDWDFFEDSR